MKLKKILAAALSAAMVLSCMTVSGGNVVQAAGETANRGVNVAPELEIVAYSGNEGQHTIDYVKDGVNNNEDDHQRWQSGVNLKGNGSGTNAAYIIFDLGDESSAKRIRSYSEIRVKFHNLAYAKNYKLLTSDTCNIKGSDTLIPINGSTLSGWEELASRSFTNPLNAYPENVFNKAEDKKITKRYLMFFFTSMNSGAGANSVSIREIEIYNKAVESIQISGEQNLELGVKETTPLTATVTPDTATYKAVTWSSSNESVATVNAETGEVTAVAPGTTTITATSKDDSTKKATCEVNVCANKSALRGTIDYADTIQNANNEEYSELSWGAFKATLEQSKIVLNDPVATEKQVIDAELALTDAILALEKMYTVTVNGQKVYKGVYNKIVTIRAPKEEDPEGEQFAGWVLDEKVVSLEREYTFAIAGDMNFTKKYISKEQTVEKNLYADVANIIMTKRADGKANIKFIAQLSIPKEYTLEETGLFWTIKDDLGKLYTDNNEPVQGVKKVNSPSISSTYQFAVNVKGLPQGRTIYGVVYAKVTDKNGETSYVYSVKESIANN